MIESGIDMPKIQKEYLTSREAAEQLGVAISTVQLWTNNGLLRAWTTGGGHRRIDPESVYEMRCHPQGALNNQTKQLSVIIVEDDAEQTRLYERQFLASSLNADVVTAADGYGAMIKIGLTVPDVIITDLMMPNMDGFQIIRALKDMPELRHCLIIAVTGLSQREVEEKGGLPQGVHLFTKPIPFETIETLLYQKAHAKAIQRTANELKS